MNNNDYDRFYSYLKDMYASHEKLAKLLSDKMDAILSDDMQKLDAIMKEEQVFVLQSRAFESNIKTHSEKLSLPGGSLSAVIEAMNSDEKPRFTQLFLQLRRKYEEVSGLNENCQALLEDKLYSIEKAIRSLDKSENSTYQKPGGQKPASARDARFLEKSI